MKMKTGSGPKLFEWRARACLRFINGKLHKFQTHWMRLPSAQNEFCAKRRAIKRRFIIRPVQCDAASARRRALDPCDWTDPADVVFHSVTQAGVVHAPAAFLCMHEKSALCRCGARCSPRAWFITCAALDICMQKVFTFTLTRESAPCYTLLPADLWRKLRFNFTADKINRGIGGACWHSAGGKIPEMHAAVSLKRA